VANATRANHQKERFIMATRIVEIEGMSCGHCVKAVDDALKQVVGVTGVTVSLAERQAVVEGEADAALLKAAVEEAGYTVRDVR
jgi:copper chaperone CopZ